MAALDATASAGLVFVLALLAVAGADTDAGDVAALGNLYNSWNSPPQLTGWSAGGGDPCGAAWAGVTCSGTAVTSIKLSGMELNGTLGYALSSLQALKTMDLSNNFLHDAIPYQLPLNLTYLNLAKNNLSGNLPYSISTMVSLEYLNLSHNSLFQEIGELFGSLNSLSEIDLSFNNLTGNIPISMGSLSKVSSLYMQNNQLSGTVDVLSNLSLATLNIANNNFSGMILLDILVDLKSAKPHGRSLSCASARLPVIGRQTLSPLGSAPCLQRHYIREEAPLGDLSESIYRVSTETLVYPISEGAGRFGSSSSYRRRHRRRPEGHRRRGDAPALHRPASSSTPTQTGEMDSSITRVGGNSFANMPTSPPPTLTPAPKNPGDQPNHPQGPISAPTITPIDQDDKKLQTGPLVGIAVASIAVASCVLFALVFYLHKTRKGNDDVSSQPKDIVGSLAVNIERATNMETPIPNNIHENAAVATSDLQSNGKMTPGRVYGANGSAARNAKVPVTATSYTVAALQVATNSFCQDSLLGEGSLGRVYKADFPNGKVLAVKKIDSASLSLYEEENFLEVISNISRLRHPNIVPLAGYCTEHGQRLLVYEYIANGTLHDILHFSDGMSKKLTWNTRVRIALGTARALEYLHEVCMPPVVHRSFKSSNILLDEEYSPHLSDCGLAALSPNPEREVSAEVVGSFGYSAPEFAMSGTYTTKSDVYSFGVVMLELLTGRKPLDSSRERSEQSLVRWATPQLHDIDLLAKMVDPAMDGLYPAKSLSRFADIIAICVQSEPEFRPPMSEVVQQLVRLMQRASIIRRQSDDLGYSYRDRVPPEGDAI